ncbi:MAG TPA: energy transducer TonB, partial [Candidatus Polarisedimenticolia bacterium]|nr:energy transducer TonB [Candidatus Polarisedimenticolia bacterium]
MAGVDGVSLPENVTKSKPVYPEEARSRRIAGNIIVNAIICADGHVEDVAILSGVPWDEGLLEGEAQRTVKTWTYR